VVRRHLVGAAGHRSLAGRLVMVAAGLSEVWVSSQPLHKVLDAWDLFQLAEHEGSEVPLGVVLHWSSWPCFVEVCPEGGLDRD